jgi:hypothetical protein
VVLVKVEGFEDAKRVYGGFTAADVDAELLEERTAPPGSRPCPVRRELQPCEQPPENPRLVSAIFGLAAIASAITGCSRWTKGLPTPFWDERPFTRPIANAHEFAVYENYLDLNDLEGEGFARASARWLLKIRKWARGGGKDPPPARFA